MSGVVVAGYGIVSSLGVGKEENFRKLQNQESGLIHAEELNSLYSGKLFFGEVPHSTVELRDMIALDFDKTSCHRTNALSMVALQEAINMAGITSKEISNAAFISASTVGGMCQDKELYYIVSGGEDVSQIHVDSFSSGACTEYVAKKYGFNKYIDTINTACSSSANSIAMGYQMIALGKFDTVVVGGVDSLTKYSVNGFNSLNLLSPEMCKPFDKNREGINLGEGAAYLILQNEEKAKHSFGRVLGFGNSNDAHHSTSISDEAYGPNLAIERALASSQLKPSDIDYINAHGTATENNDLSEGRAIVNQFGKEMDVSSTKSYTGHTLAAAGSIEAVFSLLSIEHQTAWANLNFSELDEEIGFAPITQNKQKEIKNVLSNSFGFGGNCTSLILSK